MLLSLSGTAYLKRTLGAWMSYSEFTPSMRGRRGRKSSVHGSRRTAFARTDVAALCTDGVIIGYTLRVRLSSRGKCANDHAGVLGRLIWGKDFVTGAFESIERVPVCNVTIFETDYDGHKCDDTIAIIVIMTLCQVFAGYCKMQKRG